MSLEAGEHFTAEIATVITGGEAVVKPGHEAINIGPVTCEKGRRVRLKYLGNHEVLNTDVGYALCLTEEVLADNYDDYIQNKIDVLLPDRPPSTGEETYVEINKIEEGDLGVTILGGQRVQLGPVKASVGDLVRVVGVSNDYAEIQTESAQGENYEARFNILSKQFNELPFAEGEEITTTIADAEDDSLIGYVGNVPIQFPRDGAEVAQKIDGRIVGFDRDRVLGKVIKTYDEVGRIAHADHWARMQWLRKAGFEDDPLRAFATEFLGADRDQLPNAENQLRDTLIAEALRLAIADKTSDSDVTYPRTHISGLRHWVVHKLAAILGDPTGSDNEDDEDWFRGVLSERTGPTLTFLGDILQLAEGYYAPAPSRAVMTSDSEAVLVSGQPSSVFLESSLSVEFRGISRILTGTSKNEIEKAGIPVQSRHAYVGIDEATLVTESDLAEYTASQPRETWTPDQTWEAYTGQKYGFELDEDPLEVQFENGTQVSFWYVPVEYGTDAYRLKVNPAPDTDAQMIAVPSRYRKHVCLIIDAMSGLPQGVELKPYDGDVLVNCDFVPPRPQTRWLHAIGAEWLETSGRQLQWRIASEDAASVRDVFDELPVDITDNTIGEV